MTSYLCYRVSMGSSFMFEAVIPHLPGGLTLIQFGWSARTPQRRESLFYLNGKWSAKAIGHQVKLHLNQNSPWGSRGPRKTGYFHFTFAAMDLWSNWEILLRASSITSCSPVWLLFIREPYLSILGVQCDHQWAIFTFCQLHQIH